MTGAFLTLKADAAAKLVSAQSPVAEAVEIHEMSMEGDVMRMRQITALPLPAGQEVTLKPGGYHIMLTGLKQPCAPAKPCLSPCRWKPPTASAARWMCRRRSGRWAGNKRPPQRSSLLAASLGLRELSCSRLNSS